jgi:DNA-binding NarL/FixJ family response regulator
MHDLPAGTGRRRNTAPSPLARQETAVVRGLAEGKLYKEIATDLGVSLSTVRSHASSAYAKLGVPDRAQAVLLATANGWI